jgi:hypothetical protein
LLQGIFWGLLSMCGGSIFASMKAGLGFGTPAGPGGVGDVRTRTAPGWTEQAKTVAGAVQANVAV